MIKNIYCVKCGKQIAFGTYTNKWLCKQCEDEINNSYSENQKRSNSMIIFGILVILSGGGF